MKTNSQDIPDSPLEQLPATRPGERVLRRPRKPRGKLRGILEGIRGRLRGKARKYLRIR